MQLRKQQVVRYVMSIAIAGVVSMCGPLPLIAQTSSPEAGPAAADSVESKAREGWRAALSSNPATTEGCFEAAYPSLVWERVQCAVGEPRVRPAPRTSARASADGEPNTVGSGHDWALGATGLITAAAGLFTSVKNVTSETGVGVAAYGDGGILGPNEFSLQLNTNANATTTVCQGHKDCTVWQQYLYVPDAIKKGEAGVFIQYWLLNWGTKACPTGWAVGTTGDCYRNSLAAVTPDLKITDLPNMVLEGYATPAGNDEVIFYNGTKAYAVTAKDSILDLGTVWREAEFNVVGNSDGSRADFNAGASIIVLLEVHDGSSKRPSCLANAGTTGETNNLVLDPCITLLYSSQSNPAIEFEEQN